MNETQADNKPAHGNQTHGLTTLKKAIKTIGGRVIDRRTSLGKALDQWRGQLIADLGGPEMISTQELAIVNLAVKTNLLLDSVDVWLLQQPTLINSRKRKIHPAVLERQQLSDALARYIAQLGLKRRAKPTQSIADLLAKGSASRQP
jgi:hypothetical protein